MDRGQSGTRTRGLHTNRGAAVLSLPQQRTDRHTMELGMTPCASRSQHQRSARVSIDQRELRSILSNLSHELCRPLASMRAGFDLLLGEAPSSITHDQRGHLLTMVSLCDDLLRLTRSYLDYAGIVQGSRTLCLGSFTIGALIGEIDRQFAPFAAARRIKWESHALPPETLVVTDASRCQQIFGNLVSNALKYTPVGGRVRVAAKVETSSWSVIVSDTGPGIPAESIDKVFEPFLRLARDEYSGIEGYGLGLAICRELVSQLQGEIALESTVGHGTSVTVRFPIASAGTTRSNFQ
jgi:signal transduction histidine kinase